MNNYFEHLELERRPSRSEFRMDFLKHDMTGGPHKVLDLGTGEP